MIPFRLKLEKQSLEDKVSHLETSLGHLEAEKADMKSALKTAGIERVKLSQLKDEAEVDNNNLKNEVFGKSLNVFQ